MDVMFVTGCCVFLLIEHKKADKDPAACSSSPSDAGMGEAAEGKCIHPPALAFLLQNTLTPDHPIGLPRRLKWRGNQCFRMQHGRIHLGLMLF